MSAGKNMLFVNADDWGRDRETTDRILACRRNGRIQGISAMTFMKDSERAAELAGDHALDAGLHLNLTQEFTGNGAAAGLRDHHRRVAAYLGARKANQVLYNPALKQSFDHVFRAQWDEFHRLYGRPPDRLDGHHHMHLCMNMLLPNRYPKGLRVRRNFSFRAGEKGFANRFYRRLVDSWLTSRFRCTDFFFSLSPIEPERIRRILSLSKSASVELMVHPARDDEFHFLSGDWPELTAETDGGPCRRRLTEPGRKPVEGGV
jgi:predicted glycoside hydrolase/deacetylase ChbG (UPF0249 family)